MTERDYWLSFSLFPGVGPVKFQKLLKAFGSAQKAWGAPVQDLKPVLGVLTAVRFDQFRQKFSSQIYLKTIKNQNVSFLTLEDKEYPRLLAQIPNPPFVLYVKGKIGAEVAHQNFLGHAVRLPSSENFAGSPHSIAVVGTRRITNYGREVTEMFVRELVAAGFTIVSGLALGVDAVAHKTAVEAGGRTIAVLGCGVDCCTPSENQAIYDRIIQTGGLIVSELPLGHPPTKGSFPRRNRIIAGLSLGVLVTEGAEDSGSLITAEYALKFSRRVFAVPGPITSSLSKGPYKLIQKGAKLVTTVEDILNVLKIQNSKIKITSQKLKIEGTKEEILILKILESGPVHFDEIARHLGIESSQTARILSFMEIKGIIKTLETGLVRLDIDHIMKGQ